MPRNILFCFSLNGFRFYFIRHSKRAQAYQIGAHREGFSANIAPSNYRRLRTVTLREELSAEFQNPFNLNDTSLFIEVPDEQATHNNLPTHSGSPLFTPADLPLPSSPSSSDSSEPRCEQHNSEPPPSYSLKPPSTSIATTSISPPTLTLIMSQKMPPRGDRSAPKFDSSQPRELGRFFSDLEFLFQECNVISDAEKKAHATRYLSMEDADIWTSVTEYTDVTKTFADFKNAIIRLYPASNDLFRHTMNDIDLLVGMRQRIGIFSLLDLADYTRQFKGIAQVLLNGKIASESDLQRAYVRGFQPSLWIHVINRLQHLIQNISATAPYDIDKVYEAASWVLQSNPFGSAANTTAFPPMMPPMPYAPAPASGYPHASMYAPAPMQNYAPIQAPIAPQAPQAPEPEIKMENLKTIFADFQKGFAEILAQAQHSNQWRGGSSGSGSSSKSCNFCGKEHFIRDCKLVDEYIVAGKCKRNIEGKVVLPSGSFVPREITGSLLKDRVDEWHRRNPNQLAAGALLHVIAPSPNPASTGEQTPFQPTYTLSVDDRIASLQAEIFNLRTRKAGFVPVIRTRGQKAREITSTEDDEVPENPPPRREASESPTDQQEQHPVSQIAPINAPPRQPAIPQVPQAPEHPFRNANDASYAPRAKEMSGQRTSRARRRRTPHIELYRPSMSQKSLRTFTRAR